MRYELGTSRRDWSGNRNGEMPDRHEIFTPTASSIGHLLSVDADESVVDSGLFDHSPDRARRLVREGAVVARALRTLVPSRRQRASTF